MPRFAARAALHAALVLSVLAALAVVIPAVAVADPPVQVGSQVPGYYRLKLGAMEVTALYDGYIDLDTKLMKGATAEDIQRRLARMFVEDIKGVQTAVNAYLVHTGTQLILVDTGTAKLFGPSLGAIRDNIAAAGYRPEQIDMVLLTHLHPDHAGGLLTPEGGMAFPKAEVRAAKPEADYWLSEAVAARQPEEAQALFRMARDAVAPYLAAGRFATFTPGDMLLPGLASIPEAGHTPGHSGYLFSSAGHSLLVWGDVVHYHAVQFNRPEVAVEFDVDAKRAIAVRKRLLARAAKDRLIIAGAHLPFPGLGHVRKDAKGYSWVPVEYGPIRDDRP